MLMEEICGAVDSGSPAALKPTDKTPSPDVFLDHHKEEDRPFQMYEAFSRNPAPLLNNIPTTNDYTFYANSKESNAVISPFAAYA